MFFTYVQKKNQTFGKNLSKGNNLNYEFKSFYYKKKCCH